MWYEWESIESFNEWHFAICQALGIPNEQTTDYTKPIIVDDKIIAVVHDSEATGLTPTDLRPKKPEGL
jgi:hypothetical protein